MEYAKFFVRESENAAPISIAHIYLWLIYKASFTSLSRY